MLFAESRAAHCLGPQVEAGDSLHRVNGLLDFIANHTSDLIIISGVEGTPTYISPASRQLTGYGAEELMVSLSLDLVHPGDRSGLLEFLRTPPKSEASVPPYRILRKDGNYRWIESTINVRRHPLTGEVVEVITLSRDISVQMWAKQKLIQMNTASDAMIVVRTDGLILSVNDQTKLLFGYSDGEMIGKSIEMLMPAAFHANRDALRSAFSAASAEVTLDLEPDTTGLHKNGSKVPIEIRLEPLLTPDGQFVLVSITDMTLRKRAEDLLLQSERSLRLVADAMPQIVWTARPDGYVDYYNKQWYDFTGSPKGLAEDESWETILHQDDVQRHKDSWSSSLASQSPYEIQYRFWDRRSRSYRWYLARALPMRDHLGAIAKWVGTATDIDDHKRLSDELERRVDDRTTDLQRSLLEKTTLLMEVHHRVKNNLQIICSLLYMQIECSTGNSLSDPLKDAHSRVLAMSLIHEQIYQSDTVSNLDLGHYIESLAARLFTAYCVDPARIKLKLNVCKICLNLDQAIPCGLILNELLANSLKHAFSDGRKGILQISLKRTTSGYIEFIVADNGVGLPANIKCRGNRSLGLQIVDSLISQLRADLFVSGDGGATFRFGWQVCESEDQPTSGPNLDRIDSGSVRRLLIESRQH